MKRILLAFSLLPILAAAQDSPTAKPFKIKGKATGLAYEADWVYLQYRVAGEWKTDSAQAVGGKYELAGKIEEPLQGSLRIKYKDTATDKKIALSNRRDRAVVFLQPGTIKITSVDSFSNITVKGSAAHTEYVKLNALGKPHREKLEPLMGLYSYFNKNKENSARDRVETVIDSLDKLNNENVYGAYVKNNPKSPIALYALQQYAGWDLDPDQVEPLFLAISESARSTPGGVEFGKTIDIAKRTAVGRMAMDFTQNDTLDRPVSLASLRGKYLLIDFWASWCGPCRAENPNVVKVFNKYHDKGFTIIGVSLDRPGQKEKWLKAIHDDNLTWTQVSDLQFWNNEVAKQYGIQAIPQNLLLDPTGKIIAKNVRGEELEKKVGEAIEGGKAF